MDRAEKLWDVVPEIKNQRDFLQKVLVDSLDWKIDPSAQKLEDISYSWTREELRANDVSSKIVEGGIRQIQPLTTNQPWGIFLLEFQSPAPFERGRGMTTPLRSILRGLVPQKRASANRSHQKTWQREDLLFISTHDYSQFRFSYFKSPLNENRPAPISTFGWNRNETHLRTLCEFNLSALSFPTDGGVDTTNWLKMWRSAFDVESVTQKFFEEYKSVFASISDSLHGVPPQQRRAYTQQLFNRFMLMYFVQKKGWLKFRGNENYLRALYDEAVTGREDFLNDRL